MNIEDIVDLPRRSIHIVDIGAAFFGETPPYQPLLKRELGRLTAFEPHAPSREPLQQHLGEHARVLPYAVGDGGTHILHECQAPGMNSLLEPDERALAFFNLLSEFGRARHGAHCDHHRAPRRLQRSRPDRLSQDGRAGFGARLYPHASPHFYTTKKTCVRARC